MPVHPPLLSLSYTRAHIKQPYALLSSIKDAEKLQLSTVCKQLLLQQQLLILLLLLAAAAATTTAAATPAAPATSAAAAAVGLVH